MFTHTPYSLKIDNERMRLKSIFPGRKNEEKAIVRVISKFCEKGGEGVPVRQVLNILAGEFVIFFKHAPTSASEMQIFMRVVEHNSLRCKTSTSHWRLSRCPP